jgi:hypothetical protein
MLPLCLIPHRIIKNNERLSLCARIKMFCSDDLVSVRDFKSGKTGISRVAEKPVPAPI